MKAEETCFRTIVEVPRWANPMEAHQHFVLLGSCFAQNIGELFQSYGLNALCNPLGVTYNPESIAIQVKQALDEVKSEKLKMKNDNHLVAGRNSDSSLFTLHSSLFHFEGKWRSWWASTLFSDTDEERFRYTWHKRLVSPARERHDCSQLP